MPQVPPQVPGMPLLGNIIQFMQEPIDFPHKIARGVKKPHPQVIQAQNHLQILYFLHGNDC